MYLFVCLEAVCVFEIPRVFHGVLVSNPLSVLLQLTCANGAHWDLGVDLVVELRASTEQVPGGARVASWCSGSAVPSVFWI